MTINEMKAKLTILTGETNSDILLTFLDMAAEAILKRCYPFRDYELMEVPQRYHATQLEIAAYLLNKRGAEGETSHNENGINRSYENGSVPDSMLRNVVPFAASFTV